MKNRKKIFFYKYDYFIFLVSLIYKILGYDIEYFSLENNRNKNFKKILQKYFNIKEINYEDYNLDNPDNFMSILNYYLDLYFYQKDINKYSEKISYLFFNNIQDINILLKRIYSYEYNNFFEVLMLVDYNNKNGKNVYLFCIEDDFIKFVSKKINNKKIIFHKLNRIIFLFDTLKKIFSTIFYKINSLKKFFKKNQISKYKINSYNNEKNIFYKKFLYFPHKGINYGNNEFIKDHFFSYEKTSRLHFSNFLFIALNNQDEGSDFTRKFYTKNNIDFINLEKITKLKFLKVNYFNILKLLFSPFFNKRIIYSYLKYNIYVEFLKNFKKIDGIFIGYDFLFPLEMCMAARYLNIKTFASQERSDLLYEPGYQLIIDYYNVITKNSLEVIENNKDNFNFRKIYNIGSMRVQDLYNEFFINNNQSMIDKNYYNKFQYICAVFDFHSEKDYDKNKKKRINNWKNNKSFYKLIDFLSHNQKDILFIIKSKNYDYLKLDYFKDIITKLKSSPNILFANMINNATAYKILSISNFSICRYSSLCEEMSFFKFPYVVYDEIGYLKKTNFHKYMKIINNDKVLNGWINDIKTKETIKDKIKLTKSISHYQTKKSLQKIIEGIIF